MTAMDQLGSNSFLDGRLFRIALAFVAIYVAFVFTSYLYAAFSSPLSKVPGPRLNALSQLPFSKITWDGLDNKEIPRLHTKYGRIVRVSPNFVSLLGDRDIWRQVHGFPKSGRKDYGAAVFQKDPNFYVSPLNRARDIINSDNANHTRLRKIVSHAFSDKALKEQEPMLKGWASKLKEKLAEYASSQKPVDMVLMLNCTTFDVMSDLTFGKPLDMLQNSQYVPWVKRIFDGVKSSSRLRSLRSFSKLTDFVVSFLMRNVTATMQAIHDHRQFVVTRVDDRLENAPDHPDLWSRILQKSEGPEGLSKEEHYSTASIFMIAGTETTATALSGGLCHLLKHPQYIEKLTEVIRRDFADFDSLQLEPLQACDYLDAVLKEILRLYPPVPIALPRVVPEGGAMIAGYFIPENTRVAIHHLATYSSESNFRNAHEFRPERWLGDPEYEDDNRDSFEPFSFGPRNCLGKNLAWHEMRLLLATIVLHFDLKLLPESQGWLDQNVYTLWQKPALMFNLTEV